MVVMQIIRELAKAEAPDTTLSGALFHCGETGIRTPDTISCMHAFQACAFSHSAISPKNSNPELKKISGGEGGIQ
jgi:hypothetical protein